MDKFAQNIYDKISFIFTGLTLLPTFGYLEDRERYTFVAKPRQNENFERIKGALSGLKSGVEVEDSKSLKHGHEFTIDGKKVSILYAKEDDSYDFFCEISSYTINSLIGKMIKPAGLKLTQNGLLYEERLGIENHQSKVGDFYITKDVRKLFELVELDYDRFKNGFETKEEFFDYITSTPYFNINKFLNPKKEYKLSIYTELQAYLILNPKPSQINKEISFTDIDNHFDDINFYAEIEVLKEKEKRKRESIGKFNGKTILNHYPDFDKKTIGTSMGYFKHSFDNVETFRDFLLDNSENEIMNKFREVVNF